MSLVRFLIKKIFQGALVFLLVSFIPGIPPYVQFTEYKVTEPVSLQGALSVNTLLNNAEHLHSGQIHGPEAFVDHKGVLYTGVHGGEIVKFVDGKIVPVAKFGKPCDGFWDEIKCGRPLGMNFGSDGLLYVADGYYGLFKVNVNTGAKIQLVAPDDRIEGKICKLHNSVDVADDGTVYWSCSSTNFLLQDGVFDGLADGSGRLLRYDPKTKSNEVLIEGLHFANGVVLSPKEDFVLVAETMRSRIHRYYLKGPKKGTRDVFIDGLPGLPDNLKSDGKGGFLVPLVVVRDKYNPVLFQSLGPFPLLRKFAARVLALAELAFEQIDKVYPNYYAKRAVHYIGHFESVNSLTPKGTMVLQLDVDGNVKHSFHNTDSSLSGISEVHWFNGAFYLGSPYNTYVGRVKLSFAEEDLTKEVPKQESKPKEQPKVQQTQQPTQKPSPPPRQPEKPSPPPQQPQKPSPPPQQPQKPAPPPPTQKPAPPPTQKPAPQPQKPAPSSQQPQKPSPPPAQPQKPSPPPTQTSKPSPQPQKTSPPPTQTQKPSPPPEKPSPPPQPTQKPSPPPQQTQKPSPSPQQTQKPSPPPQQAQKPPPSPQPSQKSPPQTQHQSSQQKPQEAKP